MSTKDAVFLASRVFAVYLFVGMLADLTYLPERILSFAHYASQSSVVVQNSYFRTYDTVALLGILLRIVALAVASWWFYKPGARIQRFFTPSDARPQSD